MNHLAQQKKKQETMHPSNAKRNLMNKGSKKLGNDHDKEEQAGYKTVQIANYQQMNATKM